MSKIFVIAPDKPSGDAFNKLLLKKGYETFIYYAKIAPRVINNRFNRDPRVEIDLKNAILVGYQMGFTKMVIACNTLQFWLEKALNLTPIEIKKNISVITTFEVLENKFKNAKNKPLFLGTTPTATQIKDFPTLVNTGNNKLQNLVQEIIWRVKGVTNSDISTSPKNIKDINSKKMLTDQCKKLSDQLEKAKFNIVILACTELPIAFGKYYRKSKLEFIDPASLI